MYKRAKLKNGLRIISCHMPKMQSAALGIWINAGSRYEAEKEKGISHFLEHMLFKGSRKYSCRKIKESIEGIGGSLNGFTSEELTCYLVKVPGRYLKLSLEILSDMVMHPLLPTGDLAKEKAVILEEIKMYKDLPQAYVHELLDELLWPGQPLGTPVIGTAESVNRIGREELLSYKKKFYNAANIVVSAAGLFNPGELQKEVIRIFSHPELSGQNSCLLAKEKQDKPGLKIFPKQTEQTHLALGFHALRREHPLKHALSLLHIILGANMSSRLFNEVREKQGLAYEIGTQLKRYLDTGALIVHAGIDNRKVEAAIGLILKELGKIKKALVTVDEFRRAKEFYLGQLELALEDTLDHMFWIGESVAMLDKVYTLEEVIKEVRRIQRADIRQVAREVLQEAKLNLALIGPLEGREQEIYRNLIIG